MTYVGEAPDFSFAIARRFSQSSRAGSPDLNEEMSCSGVSFSGAVISPVRVI